MVAIGLVTGCGQILGLDEFVDIAGRGGDAGAGGSGSTSSVGGDGGSGEPPSVPVLRLPKNDAYLGALRKSGSKRPRFVWEASVSPTDAPIEYELQYSADPDMTDAISATTEHTEFQPEEDLPIALLPPVGRRYYWRVRACSRDSCSEFSRARWINVGRARCDYNADGYDDIAISAYSFVAENAIYFYYGAPLEQLGMDDDGLVFSPNGRNDGFGMSLSCAGDVDGDGYADALTGATYHDKAYIYRGGGGDRFRADYETLEGISALGELGPYVASAGDVNGDGFGDVLVSGTGFSEPTAYVYLGGSAALDGPIALEFGQSVESAGSVGTMVSSAGDVNGDGFSDVMVLFYSSDGDVVRIYHGNPGKGFDTTPKVELVDPSGGSRFARSLDAAGDVNGDGFGDVILGSYETSHAYLYLGGPQGLSSAPDVTLAGDDAFGITVAGVGDLNNDGFDDFAVADRSPKVLVYLGGNESELDEPDTAIYRDAIEDRTGQRLGSPGDINGDGYSDLTIAITEENIVYLYLGGSVIADPKVEDTSISQPPGDREFGFAVAHR
ncbi:VCBS repeat-containing protein [Sorangium sp. So ce327]|uniref:FG-GAP repeat domain-containing protein n=1 Tax=Sorangium sp. So ce327 TaxID=3133301 RepID=UPI003F61241A